VPLRCAMPTLCSVSPSYVKLRLMKNVSAMLRAAGTATLPTEVIGEIQQDLRWVPLFPRRFRAAPASDGSPALFPRSYAHLANERGPTHSPSTDRINCGRMVESESAPTPWALYFARTVFVAGSRPLQAVPRRCEQTQRMASGFVSGELLQRSARTAGTLSASVKVDLSRPQNRSDWGVCPVGPYAAAYGIYTAKRPCKPCWTVIILPFPGHTVHLVS